MDEEIKKLEALEAEMEREAFLDHLWDGTMDELDALLAEGRTVDTIERMSRRVRKALDSAYNQGFKDAVKLGVTLSDISS